MLATTLISENLFDEVKVVRVFDNPLILRQVVKNNDWIEVGELIEKKDNPTNYQVETKGGSGPALLVFSDAFHSNE